MFTKYQLLFHGFQGEVIAIRPWTDRETVCLIKAIGERRLLMNCLMRPIVGPDQQPVMISEDEVRKLEGRETKPA